MLLLSFVLVCLLLVRQLYLSTFPRYLAANNLIGTAINIRITTFDDAFNSSYVNLYNFTLENSVSEMWDGGVYFLAVAIALFSGIWP